MKGLLTNCFVSLALVAGLVLQTSVAPARPPSGPAPSFRPPSPPSRPTPPPSRPTPPPSRPTPPPSRPPNAPSLRDLTPPSTPLDRNRLPQMPREVGTPPGSSKFYPTDNGIGLQFEKGQKRGNFEIGPDGVRFEYETPIDLPFDGSNKPSPKK